MLSRTLGWPVDDESFEAWRGGFKYHQYSFGDDNKGDFNNDDDYNGNYDAYDIHFNNDEEVDDNET